MDKIIAGLVLTALGIWAGVAWWWFLCDILKGLAVIILFIAGLLLIGCGVRGSCQAPAPVVKPSK